MSILLPRLYHPPRSLSRSLHHHTHPNPKKTQTSPPPRSGQAPLAQSRAAPRRDKRGGPLYRATMPPRPPPLSARERGTARSAGSKATRRPRHTHAHAHTHPPLSSSCPPTCRPAPCGSGARRAGWSSAQIRLRLTPSLLGWACPPPCPHRAHRSRLDPPARRCCCAHEAPHPPLLCPPTKKHKSPPPPPPPQSVFPSPHLRFFRSPLFQLLFTPIHMHHHASPCVVAAQPGARAPPPARPHAFALPVCEAAAAAAAAAGVAPPEQPPPPKQQQRERERERERSVSVPPSTRPWPPCHSPPLPPPPLSPSPTTRRRPCRRRSSLEPPSPDARRRRPACCVRILAH